MTWQPIETAPRQQRILVADAEGWVGEVQWQDSWYGNASSPGWMLANCDEEYGCYIKAVYWMPLPAPPQVQE